MIDSCSLHIGCILTCSDDTLSLDLVATQTGIHIIEYWFLEHVTRFEITGTIDEVFAFDATYFNEAGDARIRIIMPDGEYFTTTVDNVLYNTFSISVYPSIEI